MQDSRVVKLLIYNGKREFLVLTRSVATTFDTTEPDLPGAEALPGETDIQLLDRGLKNDTGLVVNTEDALQVGYDAEYEPGQGMLTRVLYLLKIDTEYPRIVLAARYKDFDWRQARALEGFESPYQVLVQTALDFYMPPQETGQFS